MKTRVNRCRCTQQSSLLSTGFTLKSQGSTGSCPSRAWLVAFTAFFNDRRETIFVILISEEGAVFFEKAGSHKNLQWIRTLCHCSNFKKYYVTAIFFFFSVIGLWKNPQCWVAIGFIVGVSRINFLLNRLWWSVTSMLLFQRHFSRRRCVHYSLLAAVTPRCLLAVWMGHLAEETWALVHSLTNVGGREYTTAVSISSPRVRNRTFLEMLLHEVQGTAAVKI